MDFTRGSIFELRQWLSNYLSARCVVAAIEPDLSALAHTFVERTEWEELKARRPLYFDQATFNGVNERPVAKQKIGDSDCSAGIVNLMSTP
jgi:hypothetical protein